MQTETTIEQFTPDSLLGFWGYSFRVSDPDGYNDYFVTIGEAKNLCRSTSDGIETTGEKMSLTADLSASLTAICQHFNAAPSADVAHLYKP